MLKEFRYRLLRHVPIKRMKNHYEKKYRSLICKNIDAASESADAYDMLIKSDIVKSNTLNIPQKNFSHIHLNITSVGNSVTIEKNPSVGHVHIAITGKNHSLRLGDLSNIVGTLNIQINGDDTMTDIGNIYVGTILTILNGKTINGKVSENTSIRIGNGCTFEGCQICSFHTGTSVSVGEKCMFSGGIYVMGSDTHPIYDYETKEIINKARHGVAIGNHCWIGSGATILKDAVVPDDCIVGWGAIVTKVFDEPHCAIAGTPAKIVKHGVTWDFEDENLFI